MEIYHWGAKSNLPQTSPLTRELIHTCRQWMEKVMKTDDYSFRLFNVIPRPVSTTNLFT